MTNAIDLSILYKWDSEHWYIGKWKIVSVTVLESSSVILKGISETGNKFSIAGFLYSHWASLHDKNGLFSSVISKNPLCWNGGYKIFCVMKLLRPIHSFSNPCFVFLPNRGPALRLLIPKIVVHSKKCYWVLSEQNNRAFYWAESPRVELSVCVCVVLIGRREKKRDTDTQ